MRALGMCCLTALLAVIPGLASAAGPVRLRLEDRTTLHVGQIATLPMPSARPVSVQSAGDALVALKPTSPQNSAAFRYRAVRPGNETLLVLPSKLRKGDCISCVTRHYFVTVVP